MIAIDIRTWHVAEAIGKIGYVATNCADEVNELHNRVGLVAEIIGEGVNRIDKKVAAETTAPVAKDVWEGLE